MVESIVSAVEYEQYSNRQLIAIPLVLLALALLVIGGWYLVYGTPASLGIEFTGGTELRIEADASESEIEAAFDRDVESVRAVQTMENTYIVTFQSTDTDAIESSARAAGFDVISVSGTSASFGAGTQRLAMSGLVVSFLGMSALVFALFRTFVPSIAVVLSAFSDIVIPVAIMNLLGIELSLGTVAALLMIIGYSVDSDILLNNHVLRRSGGFYESTYRAMRTGVTMTLTSMTAMVVMTIVSYAFGIQLLTAIGFVLVIGLATDLMNTYMMNVTLLRWYKYEGVAR